MALIAAMVAVGVALILVVTLVFAYLFSRFRFILFDAVVSGEAAIGRSWREYRPQAQRYLGFWMVFILVTLVAVSAVVGLPLLYGYKHGVFADLRGQSSGPFLATLGALFFGFFMVGLLAFILTTLAKDFLVPMLALDDLSIADAWEALKQSIRAEPAAYASYVSMKLVLVLASTVLMSMVLLLLFVLMIVPGMLLATLTAAAAKSLGVAAMAVLGTAILIGTLLLAGLAFGVTILCAAPIAVFFQSYSLYFMGGRYPKLGALLAQEHLRHTEPHPEGLDLAPAT